MIVYNSTWLSNLAVQEQAEQDTVLGRLSAAELEAIKVAYPVGFYSPNLFVRIGFFFLTWVIALFGMLKLGLVVTSGGQWPGYGLLLFFGGVGYVVLEVVVRSTHHFRSGLDDALLWIAGVLWGSGLGFKLLYGGSAAEQHGVVVLVGFLCLLSIYFTLRFADRMMTALAWGLGYILVFLGWTNVAGLSSGVLPFILMLFSAGGYWLARRNAEKDGLMFYRSNMVVVQVMSLLTLYVSGNYFVVQAMSAELHGVPTAVQQVPFRLFFWVWTIVLPLGYIVWGVWKKEVVVWRTGMLLLAAGAVTFRSYYHVMPVGEALVLCGLVLLGVAIGVIRYLRTPKHGFTCAELDRLHGGDQLTVESLVVAETFAHSPVSPLADPTRFGGGDFGGGGAGGTF